MKAAAALAAACLLAAWAGFVAYVAFEVLRAVVAAPAYGPVPF